MESIKKKAVAYVRISSLRQIDNESPETQKAVITKYAEDNDIEIIEWFYDEAKSGKNADREELQNLLQFAKKYRGKIDYLIVYNMRRASRDLDSYVQQVRAVLKAMGITVRSATESVVDDTKIGRFMENFLVLLGQLDNEGKAEVTLDNMRSLAEQGYWQHPPIVGYDTHKILNERGKMRPTLKPNAMAAKVKQVLERYSLGDITKAELTRYASEIGLRSRYGKSPSEDRINRMIKHPVYAGYVCDSFTNYELVEGKHLPIISKETFEKNQSLLYRKNSRKNETHLKHNKEYPLKGLLLCANCKNKLYASAPTTGNGKRSPRYHCARPSCKGLVRSVKAQKVHNDFEVALKRIKPSEGLLQLYKTVMIREANNVLGRLNKQINALREELNQIDNSRIVAIQKLTEGLISLEEKNQLTDMLDQKKLDKNSALKEFEQQQSIRETDIEFAITVMESVDKQWVESDLDIQIRFQKMLFPDGLVYETVNGKFGTTQISPLYRLITNKKDPDVTSESFLVAGAGLEPATLGL